jgi:hypothetical protein
LYSDSVDEPFVRRTGFVLLRKTGAAQDDMVRAVREALGQPPRAEAV